jgi:hypothetical protein
VALLGWFADSLARASGLHGRGASCPAVVGCARPAYGNTGISLPHSSPQRKQGKTGGLTGMVRGFPRSRVGLAWERGILPGSRFVRRLAGLRVNTAHCVISLPHSSPQRKQGKTGGLTGMVRGFPRSRVGLAWERGILPGSRFVRRLAGLRVNTAHCVISLPHSSPQRKQGKTGGLTGMVRGFPRSRVGLAWERGILPGSRGLCAAGACETPASPCPIQRRSERPATGHGQPRTVACTPACSAVLHFPP